MSMPPRRPGRPAVNRAEAKPINTIVEEPVMEAAGADLRDDPRQEYVEETRPEPRSYREDHRDEDPRARAAKRAAELRGTIDPNIDEADEFWVDPHIIPDGWTYEWKTASILGQENAGAMLNYRRMGWEEVPSRRHPDMMPLGSTEQFITRKGMVLMERPKVISGDFEARMRGKARQQVLDKEAEAKGGANFAKSEAGFEARGNTIRRSFEPGMPVPDS